MNQNEALDAANLILDEFTAATNHILKVKELIEDKEIFEDLLEPYDYVIANLKAFVVVLGIALLIADAEEESNEE